MMFLQSVKMWTLWRTAPWCSGSSSAAGHTSDKCAARPARDTDTVTQHPSLGPVHTGKHPHWALEQQPSLPLSQESEITLLDRHLLTGTLFPARVEISDRSGAKTAWAYTFHQREGCWNLKRGRERRNPPSLSLKNPSVVIFWCYYILVWLQAWSLYSSTGLNLYINTWCLFSFIFSEIHFVKTIIFLMSLPMKRNILWNESCFHDRFYLIFSALLFPYQCFHQVLAVFQLKYEQSLICTVSAVRGLCMLCVFLCGISVEAINISLHLHTKHMSYHSG